MADAEVIVVGGGHNGLIAATYLARAGVDTLVVEGRSEVGGISSTVSDLGARFNICNCDHALIRTTGIVEELELEEHGLHYLESEVGNVHGYHDDSDPWLFFPEQDRTLESLAHRFPRQIDAYRRYLEDSLPVARLALEMARTPSRTLRMLSRAAGRRGRGAARLLDWSRRSAAEVLAGYFDDWHLITPALSLGPTMWGVPGNMPGTGLAATGYATRHLVKSGRPRGGSGALTDALRTALEKAGGRVRCGSTVDHLELDGGEVRGVVLAHGERLEAPRVLAACDPRAVMVDWIGESGGRARRRSEDWRGRPVIDGYQAKVDAVLAGTPRAVATDRLGDPAADLDLLGPTTVISPSPEQLAANHEQKEAGRVSEHPTMLINMPSALDSDLRPGPGQQTLSLEVLFTPYSLPGGWAGSREPERWLRLWDRVVAPGGLDLVSDWRAMTPDRYEREFAMHRGHTPAYAAPPLASLLGRNREVSRHRAPVRGLYLSGAGTYPGAGIFGAAGRNAAAAVISDRHQGALYGRGRWSSRSA
ncbi:MAG: NAD(P)/FAD-dependent oxidoreductase [Actinomycetia bacterium]|nr:NAD(P)/FAD-dependent oxidoreductase [Actinomycetes bacterium]